MQHGWPTRAPPRSTLEVPSWNIDLLLPTAPPTRIYLKSSHHGVLVFADLDKDTTVGGLKTLVSGRLVLGPNQTVILSSWGRALDEVRKLCDLSLPTNARLEMRLALLPLDPSRGLKRLHVTSTCLSTRRVAADMHTTVLELKQAIHATLMKGNYEWWELDGVCVRRRGTTLLATTSLPADEKQGTDEIRQARFPSSKPYPHPDPNPNPNPNPNPDPNLFNPNQGEELIIENKQSLQGGKGTCKTYRIATGRLCHAVDSSVHILDLKPEHMTLLWTGRALADGEVLFELGLRHDDSVALEFESPVTPSELTLLRSPPKEKEKKTGDQGAGGAKGKKKK